MPISCYSCRFSNVAWVEGGWNLTQRHRGTEAQREKLSQFKFFLASLRLCAFAFKDWRIQLPRGITRSKAINFGERFVKNGIHRVANELPENVDFRDKPKQSQEPGGKPEMSMIFHRKNSLATARLARRLTQRRKGTKTQRGTVSQFPFLFASLRLCVFALKGWCIRLSSSNTIQPRPF